MPFPAVAMLVAGRWHCGELGWDSDALSAPMKKRRFTPEDPRAQELTGWPGWGDTLSGLRRASSAYGVDPTWRVRARPDREA